MPLADKGVISIISLKFLLKLFRDGVQKWIKMSPRPLYWNIFERNSKYIIIFSTFEFP